jgi:diguanylate cyclase (GGDEF)-like protein
VVKAPLVVYLTVAVALLIGVVAFGEPVRGAVAMVATLLGTIVFTVSVVRRRPQPQAAWWLVVASAWGMIATALAVFAAYRFQENVTITAPAPVLLTPVPYVLLALALARLIRAVARRGPVDTLDAAMIALAGFLLLWVFVIQDRFVLEPGAAVAIVVQPAIALVVFALAVKLALGGGLRDLVTGLFAVYAMVVLAVVLNVVILGLESGSLRTQTSTLVLWTAYGPLLGLIGLLPSFARPRRPADESAPDLSTFRLVLFSLIVLVPLVAWARDSFATPEPSPAGVTVSLVVSALLLVILVIRLALLARLAQRRANDLRLRSAELATAVSEQAALQDQLRFQATHDPLTGLANRSMLTDRLAVWRRDQTQAGAALLMVDLDGFKRINDTYGHGIGDELLIQVTHRLTAAAPGQATLARLGGDEFIMLLVGVDRAAALEIAERVVGSLRQPYELDGQRLRISASVGVLVVPSGEDPSSAELLREVDTALYEAKKAGGDRVAVREYHPAPEVTRRRAERGEADQRCSDRRCSDQRRPSGDQR